MADSTPNLAIAHIATNQNQKEVTANTAFDDLDTAMVGQLSVDVSGNVDITPSPTTLKLNFNIKLTGLLTGSISLIVPATKKFYRVHHTAGNPSVGEYTVTVKVSGQPGVVLFPDEAVLLYCDGTDVHIADDNFLNQPPTSASAPGRARQFSYDSSYLYICVAPNIWMRTAIATW